MNSRRKNEENWYQIQIMFKKSKYFRIEVYYSLESCGVQKKFYATPYSGHMVTNLQLQTSLKCLL